MFYQYLALGTHAATVQTCPRASCVPAMSHVTQPCCVPVTADNASIVSFECGICQDFVQRADIIQCEVKESACVGNVCLDCALECPYCDNLCCASCWFEFDADDMERQSCCLACAVDM